MPVALSRVVLATRNVGKLRELQRLLAGLPFNLVSLAELKLFSPEESGASFLANALLKARHAAEASGSAAIADDSGLEVDALGGAPGIHSARYAGCKADEHANNAKLVAALQNIPWERRRARYRCVLVFMRTACDAEPVVAEGVWEGYILDAARGSGGFGYDPYFWIPDLEMSAAELNLEEKNRHSHRGSALRGLRERLALAGAGRGMI